MLSKLLLSDWIALFISLCNSVFCRSVLGCICHLGVSPASYGFSDSPEWERRKDHVKKDSLFQYHPRELINPHYFLSFDYFFYVETFKATEFGFKRYTSTKYYSLVNVWTPLNWILWVESFWYFLKQNKTTLLVNLHICWNEFIKSFLKAVCVRSWRVRSWRSGFWGSLGGKGPAVKERRKED